MGAKLLINPKGGRGRVRRRLSEVEALARRHGLAWEVSESPRDLTARARRAAAAGVERLLVAGGDGSQHLAVQGLVGSETALATLPLGSGNDLAASLGVRGSLSETFAFLLAAPVVAIDLIRSVDQGDALGSGGSTRFTAGVASVGFDAAVSAAANRMRWVSSAVLYPLAALRALVSFRIPAMTVEWDGGQWSGRALMVAIANTPRYGAGMQIAPDARPDDGLLDVVLVERVAKLEVLRILPRVYSGRHVGHPRVRIVRTPWLALESDRPLLAQGDGELVGPPGVRWRFAVAPRALRVIRRER